MRPAHDVTEILEKNNDSGNDHVSLIIDAESVIPEFQRDSTKSWTVSYTDPMCREKKINELCELLKERPVEEIDGFIELARSGNSATMLTSFVNASTLGRPGSSSPTDPADAPPLWAERTTGREVSPVAWIRMHYGNKDPKNWDAMGLTVAALRHADRQLLDRYEQWVEERPGEALPIPKQVHTRRSEDIGKVVPPSFWKRTSELTPDQQEKRRAYEANKKRQQRLRKSL